MRSKEAAILLYYRELFKEHYKANWGKRKLLGEKCAVCM